MNLKSLASAARIGMFLGWTDLRQAYKRTLIGQFWITLGTLVGVAAIGVVYGFLFGVSPGTYLPYLATGLVFWNLLGSGITESAVAFIYSEGFIRGMAAPKITYVIRLMSKMLLTFAHNLIVIPLVLIFFPQGLSPIIFLALPGFILGVMVLFGIGTVIAVIATRFRDIPQILSAGMMILFYVTPVIWPTDSLPPGPAQLVVMANPLASVLQVMRLPWLNELPTLFNWEMATATALISVVVGTLVYRKYANRIAFWV